MLLGFIDQRPRDDGADEPGNNHNCTEDTSVIIRVAVRDDDLVEESGGCVEQSNTNGKGEQ